MPLEAFENNFTREPEGFSFTMRVVGSQQTLRVYVCDDALDAEDATADEAELRSQFEQCRREFEAVASEKFSRGRLAADGVVAITLADVMGFFE